MLKIQDKAVRGPLLLLLKTFANLILNLNLNLNLHLNPNLNLNLNKNLNSI